MTEKEIKEIVVISGKGGTGKTSITASFAALAENAVLADCDVDAADLHLILNPSNTEKNLFVSGNIAEIREDDCGGCGVCYDYCRFDAITASGNGKYRVEETSCEGCGVCVEFCPDKAIDFPPRECGEWYVSDTRFGIMVHAKLLPGGENSGKLVSLVRNEAKKSALINNRNLIITDGPPGTGCPVIAAVTGASAVVVVTEPTLSGIHDLERVLSLVNHFKIKAFVVVNKWDINPGNAERIKEISELKAAVFLGMVPYSKDFTKAQIEGHSVIENSEGVSKDNILKIWEKLKVNLHLTD